MWCCGSHHHLLSGRGFSISYQQKIEGKCSCIPKFSLAIVRLLIQQSTFCVCLGLAALEVGQNSHWLNWEQHQAKYGYFYLSLLPLHLLPPPPSPWVRGNEFCFSFLKVYASSEQEPCHEVSRCAAKEKGREREKKKWNCAYC